MISKPERARVHPAGTGLLLRTEGAIIMMTHSDDGLYQYLDHLTLFRQKHGRGRNPEAAQARHYCKTMRKQVKAELKRRGLPARKPDDTRTYGPGQTAWQGKGAQ